MYLSMMSPAIAYCSLQLRVAVSTLLHQLPGLTKMKALTSVNIKFLHPPTLSALMPMFLFHKVVKQMMFENYYERHNFCALLHHLTAHAPFQVSILAIYLNILLS